MDYYRIDVRLLEAKPAPWRQFLIKKTATFEDLHQAIQDACGWTNSHLYSFSQTERGPVVATIPDDDYAAGEPDARKVKLSTHLSTSATLLYQYDFGDSWWHEVTVLDVVPVPQRFIRQLLAGERAFPPEDCGGIPGYENCVAVAFDRPTDEIEDVEELREWMGDWHPERFDFAAVKRGFDS
jgi:hypothetical protein